MTSHLPLALRCLPLLAAALALGAISCGGAQDGQTSTPGTGSPKPEADDPPQKQDDTATIDAYCTPAGEVLIDGKPAGKAPLKGFKVAPGSHDVTCVDETGNRTMGVTLEPGEGKSVISDRPINAGKR
jgi:hypothetical protein